MREKLTTLLTRLNTGRKQTLDSLLHWRRHERAASENIGGLGAPEALFLVLCIYLLVAKRTVMPDKNKD